MSEEFNYKKAYRQLIEDIHIPGHSGAGRYQDIAKLLLEGSDELKAAVLQLFKAHMTALTAPDRQTECTPESALNAIFHTIRLRGASARAALRITDGIDNQVCLLIGTYIANQPSANAEEATVEAFDNAPAAEASFSTPG
jgi:hypothetical protein